MSENHANEVQINGSEHLPHGWCLAQSEGGTPLYLGPVEGLPRGLDYRRLYLSLHLMVEIRRRLNEPPAPPPAPANAA